MKEIERKNLLSGLKSLYGQNNDFLASIENGTAKREYEKPAIEKVKKRNAELADYITQIENGGNCTRTLNEWCNLFVDILVGGGW